MSKRGKKLRTVKPVTQVKQVKPVSHLTRRQDQYSSCHIVSHCARKPVFRQLSPLPFSALANGVNFINVNKEFELNVTERSRRRSMETNKMAATLPVTELFLARQTRDCYRQQSKQRLSRATIKAACHTRRMLTFTTSTKT